MPLDFIRNYLDELQATMAALPIEQIGDIVTALLDARERDAQVFAVGNGGSAATASHFAVDLGKGASWDGGRFRVLSLTDNVPWLTALANDVSYEDVFVEQLKNYARAGDLLLAISGSGNSENVLRAVRFANSVGCRTIGLAGFGGGRLKQEAQQCLVIPSDHMGRSEDAHLIVLHAVLYFLMSMSDRGVSSQETAPPA